MVSSELGVFAHPNVVILWQRKKQVECESAKFLWPQHLENTRISTVCSETQGLYVDAVQLMGLFLRMSTLRLLLVLLHIIK